MPLATTETLAEYLGQYDTLVEVGIGSRSDVAAALAARGCRVTATDIRPRQTPDGVRFVRDDITDPDESLYDAEAVYALNCPPELQPSLAAASPDGTDCLFTTLGGDPAVVSTTPTTLSNGVTLFRVEV
ncbi:MAG: UPF0146 family protein [Natronomonas sp.]